MNKKIILPLIALSTFFIVNNCSAITPTQTYVYFGGEETATDAQWYFEDQSGGNPGGWQQVGTGWDREINNESVYYTNFQLRFDTNKLAHYVPNPDPNGFDIIVRVYMNGRTRLDPRIVFSKTLSNTPWGATPPTGFRPFNFTGSVGGWDTNDEDAFIFFGVNLDGNLPSNMAFYSTLNCGGSTGITCSNESPFHWTYKVVNESGLQPYSTGVNGLQVFYYTDDAATAQHNSINAMANYMESDYYKQNQAELDYIAYLEQLNSGNNDHGLSAASVSILTGVNTFIGALHNVQQTDCKLPDGASVYSLDLSGMDFCSLSLPSQISAIGQVAGILILVPLGWHFISRIIDDFGSIVEWKGLIK